MCYSLFWKAGQKEVSRLSVQLPRNELWVPLCLVTSDQRWVKEVLRECGDSRASPSLKTVPFLALLSGSWRGLWRLLALSMTWISCLELDPSTCPAPSVAYQLIGVELSFIWDVGGVKGDSRNSSLREALWPPHETPPTIRCLQVALSEDRDQAFYIKGALNIFYFLKRTMFVNSTYTGKLLKMYLIL